MVKFYEGYGITLGTGVIFLVVTAGLFVYFSARITVCLFKPVGTEILVGATEEIFYMLSCNYVKSFVGVLIAALIVGLVLIIYSFIEKVKEQKTNQTQIR